MPSTVSSKNLLTSILTSLQSINSPNEPTAPTQPSISISPIAIQVQQPHKPSLLKTLSQPSTQQAKSVLLTLHFLFPHELLPALDLIDRRLITDLTTIEPAPTSLQSTPTLQIYYVQSASSATDHSTTTTSSSILTSGRKSGRFRNALSKPGVFYEVDLESWNCSCPAFAFNGLRLMIRRDGNLARETGGERPGEGRGGDEIGIAEGREWLVGGVATKDDALVPICKHILAVALTRAAPLLFGGGVLRREASREEMAGWAAGWGE